MPTSNPLDQLRDIHTPLEVSIWPLAPGWWLLIALTAILIAYCIYSLIKTRTFRKARKQALFLLDELYNSQKNNSVVFCKQTNVLLKRLAISMGHTQSKALYGDTWLIFLDSSLKNSSFQKQLPEFANACFTETANIDTDLLYKLARNWVKRVSHV